MWELFAQGETKYVEYKNEYTNAAALLSDNTPLLNANVSLIRFDGDSVLNIKDRTVLSGRSIIDQFDECMNFYSSFKEEAIVNTSRTLIDELIGNEKLIVQYILREGSITRRKAEAILSLKKDRSYHIIYQHKIN